MPSESATKFTSLADSLIALSRHGTMALRSFEERVRHIAPEPQPKYSEHPNRWRQERKRLEKACLTPATQLLKAEFEIQTAKKRWGEVT